MPFVKSGPAPRTAARSCSAARPKAAATKVTKVVDQNKVPAGRDGAAKKESRTRSEGPRQRSRSRNRRRVQMLDPRELESAPKPTIRIQAETNSASDSCRRLLAAAGLTVTAGLSGAAASTTIPQLSPSVNLCEPGFQSSLALMNDLERLRHLSIDTRSLARAKLESDKSASKSTDKKVSCTLNTDPARSIFSQLEPLTVDPARVLATREVRLQQLAERCAPKKRPADPQFSFNDLVQVEADLIEPSVPRSRSFLSECHAFGVDPMRSHQVPDDNYLEAYSLMSSAF